MTEPSNSELDRRFTRLENSINSGFDRLDKQIAQMVTHDVFTMFQEAMTQRVTATEERANALSIKHDKDMADLRDEVDQVEKNRADDRRNMIKIVATVTLGILSVVATLAGIFLPMLLNQ